MTRPAGALQKKMAAFCTDSTACFQSEMRKIFFMRGYDTPPDEQQTEGSRKQTKAAQRADLLHNNRSAANSLAQTIGAASSSTQEAQVESNASPPPLHERRSRQKAPRANQLRLARRRPEFFGQAHERRDLVQLPWSPRSDLAHAALNSAAAQALVAQELVKEQACFSTSCLLQIFCLLFFGEEGKGLGAHERKQGGRSGAGRASSHRAPVGRAGRRRPCPNGAPLEIFGRVSRREEAAGASRWGLGSEIAPRGDGR